MVVIINGMMMAVVVVVVMMFYFCGNFTWWKLNEICCFRIVGNKNQWLHELFTNKYDVS